MIDLLTGILSAVGDFAQLVLVGMVGAVNLVVAAVGALIAALTALFPSLPSPPSLAGAAWIGWLNWFVPVGPLLAGLAVFVSLWVAMLVLRVPLRWVKVL